MIYNEPLRKSRKDFTSNVQGSKLSGMLLCLYVILLFTANISVADEVTIGTGSGLYDHLPIEPFYTYTYSQSIFLKSELGVSGPIYIDAIEYQWNGCGSWTDAVKVYMGHTTYSSFPTWKTVSTMTQVFSGNYSVSSTAGWYRIDLDEPFYYNNSDNIVIAVDENTGTFHNYGSSFYTTSQGSNRSIYYYSDTYNPDPSCPPTGVLTGYCPNIKIIYHLPPPENYADWGYSKDLVINTTSSGADIENDVLNYPLLVRLGNDNFDFSQAESDGSDIRFAKPDGEPLQYEIEHWDAGNQTAEVWVNVDVIYANNNEQFIVMYWGKSDAPDLSSPEDVFDNDFKGTWHLDDFNDATASHNHGTNNGSTDEDGIIGKAKSFDGADDFISLPDACPVSGAWTLDFWVKPNSPDDYERIFTLGSGGCSSRQIMALWRSGHIEFRTSTSGSAGDPQAASGPITDGEWSHVMWTFDGANHGVYVNGVSSEGTVSGSNVGIDGNNYFGTRLGTGNFWTGSLDELRISDAARTSDWGKLSFETQKSGTGVIWTFKCPMNSCVGDNVRVSGDFLHVDKDITLGHMTKNKGFILHSRYHAANDFLSIEYKKERPGDWQYEKGISLLGWYHSVDGGKPGNVGIGTNEPKSKLDVTGAIRNSGPVEGTRETGTILFRNTSEQESDIEGMGDGFRMLYVEDFDDNDQSKDVLVFEKTDSNIDQNNGYADGGILFRTVGTTTNNDPLQTAISMYLDGKGNVGIGKLDPSTRLDVNGTVTADQFKVGEWVIKEAPDYVFNKDYFLRPLKDVEEYIKKNKHLPEVPSADEIEENGVDLVEMNMTLLKKIEELHLYIIQQQKEIEELRKAVGME